VNANHPVLAIVLEGGEHDVPVGFLDGLFLSGRQLVPREVRELAAFVGKVDQEARFRGERSRTCSHLALMRRDVLHFFSGYVVEVNIGVRSRVWLKKSDELLVI